MSLFTILFSSHYYFRIDGNPLGFFLVDSLSLFQRNNIQKRLLHRRALCLMFSIFDFVYGSIGLLKMKSFFTLTIYLCFMLVGGWMRQEKTFENRKYQFITDYLSNLWAIKSTKYLFQELYSSIEFKRRKKRKKIMAYAN